MIYLYYILLVIYTSALVYITFYCLLQLHLLYCYKKSSKQVQNIITTENDWPFVTIQLPIFNEQYVVERLVDNIMQIDYPKDKFEVHILDDSTDETIQITKKKVEEYKAKGYHIEQVLRDERTGYKAGALKAAMPRAKGEFMAIFDADFLPRKEFLKATIPHFNNPKIGVVQTRWEHINENYSLITRLQAVQLNVHFTVEQKGRELGDYMLQFNGTAGVWRKKTIEDAGGWEADTLTEDLDLSIRAQLKGWKIHFLEEVGSPAELPAEMNGLKSQQFRWMKGGAETAKKMLPTVWKSELSFWKKFHTTIHLLASSVFVFVFIIGVFSIPLMLIFNLLDKSPVFLEYFMIGWLSIISIYYVANVQNDFQNQPYFKRLIKFIILFPLFLGLSMGLSLHNTVAVIQGFRGKKSPFIRTPKFNIQGFTDSFKHKKYRTYKISWTTVFEGLLTLYFLMGSIWGMYNQNFSFLFFHMLLTFGYGTIFYYTLKHLSLR